MKGHEHVWKLPYLRPGIVYLIIGYQQYILRSPGKTQLPPSCRRL